MDYTDFIIDYKNNINFLELKEEGSFRVGDEIFEGPINLPIVVEDLLKLVKEDIDDIPLNKFIDGMLYVLALDYDFRDSEKYVEILAAYTEDISQLIMTRAIKAYDKKEYKESLIYLRALSNLNLTDERALFLEGSALENLDISQLSPEEKTEYVQGIMNIYERIINMDETFYLAYYKLGYIYKDMMQYLKAQMTLEEYLKYSEDDIKKQEIRNLLDEMEGSVLLERGILDMNAGDYEGALDKLGQVREEQMTPIHYYHLSLIYTQLRDVDKALESINQAIDREELGIYHNQRAIVYQNMGQVEKGIKELEDAIDRLGPDYHMVYNLGTMYYNKRDLQTALGNFEIAYEINPTPELASIISQVELEMLN